MEIEENINDDTTDIWETSNSVFADYKEENALKHLTENTELRTDRFSGFDNNSGDSWIYPTNYPVRKYQHDIVYNALFKNTLVCLPTGLGKTFIAAVVMYNFYRWYPQGKLIFMAPTKPLVMQQIDACYDIMGIPKEDTSMITGATKKENRLKQWNSKRVFFATPQSVVSDISDPNFPIQSIKLVVIDEAHKAKGKFAYCEVIRIIKEQNEMFRVVALSATPGRETNDVAEVVHNLLISHIEVRTEKCPDVVSHIHRKQIETIVVRLNGKIRKYRDELINIIDPYVQNLIGFDVIVGTTESLSKGWLLMQKKKFQKNHIIQPHPLYSEVMTDFASSICLYYALELLERHGQWPFLNYYENENENFVVAKDYKLKQFLVSLREDIGSNPYTGDVNDTPIPSDFDFGHPKYDELQKCLKRHISSANKSQAIVFCEFRHSAFLIHQMLLQKGPHIKPAMFIGQSSTTGQKGITQKQQIATMADFRKGIYNVLIATCVAEEGIDCGEVDLIVCFDVTSTNPTRLVQRMGRTGRKRNGRVIFLVAEGKEQKNLKDSMTAKEHNNKELVMHSEVVDSLCRSPRLVPSEFDPKCVQTFIQTGAKSKDNHKDEIQPSSDKRSTFQPPSTSRDIRNFYQTTTSQLTVNTKQSKDASNIFSTAYKNSLYSIPSRKASESETNSNDRLKIPTFWELIRDEKTPSALKAFAVKRNVHSWQENFVTKSLSSVDESAILCSLNDAASISNFIKSARPYATTKTPTIVEFNCRDEPYDPSFAAKLTERFIHVKKIQKLNEGHQISSSSEEKSKTNESSVLDLSDEQSQMFIPFYDPIESKYEESKISNESKVFGSISSTPLKAKHTPLKSSTPLNSKKKANKSINNRKDSPLIKAFERCKTLNQTKRKTKRISDPLAFLGIKDILDVFVDYVSGDDEGEVAATKLSVESEKTIECLPKSHNQYEKTATNSCVRPTVEIGTNQEPEEYTVSQILQIVNVDGNDANRKVSENNNLSIEETMSNSKRIYIGTIEEIFGGDDNVEISKTLFSDKQSASEEDDVIASSQSVISELKLPSKSEKINAKNNKIKSFTKLPQSGDDMFASFLTTESQSSSSKSNKISDLKHLPSESPLIKPISEVIQTTNSNITAETTTSSKATVFKSPSTSNGLSKTVDRSPSVFSRKINLSRLASLSSRSNSERPPSNNFQRKSPLFFSCGKLDVSHSQQSNDQQSKLVTDPDCNDSQADEDFRIHRNPNKRNRVISDTIIEESPLKNKTSKSSKTVFKKPKISKCAFIDDECDASDASSDEFEATDAYIDSIICNDDVHDDPSVNMHAVYLQSVKSPIRKNGFKFSKPSVHRNDINIFSQTVVQDDDDYDTSFVVDEVSEESELEMSVLERAEWLLKMKRKAKRKSSNNNSSSIPKRRKVIVYDDSSDENV